MISVRDTIPTGRIPASTTGIRFDPARPQEFQHVAQMGALPDRDALPRHDRADGGFKVRAADAPLPHQRVHQVHDRHRLPAADEPDDVAFRDDPGKAPVRAHDGRAGNAVIVEEDDQIPHGLLLGDAQHRDMHDVPRRNGREQPPPGYLVGMGVDFLEIARGDVQIRADFLHPLVDVLPAEREGIA